MNPVMAAALLLLVFTAWWGLRASPATRTRGRGLRGSTAHGARRLYTRRNVLALAAAISGAAILVYSGADEAVEEWHRRSVKNATTDRLAKFLHHFGERWWFALFGGFTLVDRFLASSPVSRWGRASFEAMVVGLPTLWSVQRVLGGARPQDDTHGPRYVPFADDNAASGHTFIAAIPCLVAARRLGRMPARGVAYALSPWVGWSRINDRKHYLSQVLLGYGIAWRAVDAVVDPTTSDTPVSAPE